MPPAPRPVPPISQPSRIPPIPVPPPQPVVPAVAAPPLPEFDPAGGFGPGAGFGPSGDDSALLPMAVGDATGRNGWAVAENPAAQGQPPQQDEERKRPKYLQESELDGLFGSDQLTAPPVIGGD